MVKVSPTEELILNFPSKSVVVPEEVPEIITVAPIKGIPSVSVTVPETSFCCAKEI